MNPPIPSVAYGNLTATVSWHYWSLPNPIPLEFGAWAKMHKLHARGSDSTAANRGSGPVRSTLKRIWSGQKGRHNARLNGANIWVVFENELPIGVVVFESTTVLNASAPSAQQFCVNMWLDPARRQRGIIGEMLRAIASYLAPYTCHPKTAILAGDASVSILKKMFSAPIHPLVIYSNTYESSQTVKSVRY